MKHAAGVLIACLALATAGCSEDADPEPFVPTTDSFDADRAFADLRAQVAIGTRHSGSPGGDQVVALISKRLRAIDGVEGVRVQEPWRNVVARIPGAEPGAIVVGAHHDTKDDVSPDFEGANDGASGVAVVLELARALGAQAPLDGPSIELALFDGEESRGGQPFTVDGTRGSRQYVELAVSGGGLGAPAIGEIKAMVLFDLVGDCDLALPREESSDPGLYGAFVSAAAEIGEGSAGPFAGEAPSVLDDHIPFLEAGVPAVDIIDFTYGPGPSPGEYWHTPEDTLDKVCPESLDAVGETALAALPRLRP